MKTDLNKLLMDDWKGALEIIGLDVAHAIGLIEEAEDRHFNFEHLDVCYKGFELEMTSYDFSIMVMNKDRSRKEALVTISRAYDIHAIIAFLADALAGFMIEML